MLRADHASVAWNAGKKHWEVRIQVGGEVMKRQISPPHGESGVEALKARAIEIAKDEGYELDPAKVAVEESPSHAA
jgi:hypothetical protein